jgi:hypothetical protein
LLLRFSVALIRGGGAAGSDRDRLIAPPIAPVQAPIEQHHFIPPAHESLPSGWQAATDCHGRTYYIDHSTQQTHWTLPGTSQPMHPGLGTFHTPTDYGAPPAPSASATPNIFIPGASPLQALSLAQCMSGMSVSDGPALPACQPDDAVNQMDEIVASAMKCTPANLTVSPGAAILVIAGGSTIVRHCWGQENVGAGKPITEQTVFDLASLSKQFTALAVVRLVGEGCLSLAAPLSAYVADFAPTPKSKATSSWAHVTVQHLLHHISGLHATVLCLPAVSTHSVNEVF